MANQIYIKNIYYMLSYAYSMLKQTNYENIESEDFDYIHDLLASIIQRAVVQQLKQGLYKEYIEVEENISTIRGKININETIKNKLIRQPKVVCNYDELTENNTYNQVIKATLLLLLRIPEVKKETKVHLKSLIMYFDTVDTVEINSINWSQLHYNKSNQSYQMILTICYFLIKNQLLSHDEGYHKVMGFTEDHMHRLYEKFILEYYRKHYPQLHPKAKHVNWDLEDDEDLEFMPAMITDIYLTDGNKSLIIDAKYYSKTMQQTMHRRTYHSQNLYQIMSYVTHADKEHKHNVKGVLLYAKTNEDIVPDRKIKDRGYEYEFTTLDLNTDFHMLCKQLDRLVDEFF